MSKPTISEVPSLSLSDRIRLAQALWDSARNVREGPREIDLIAEDAGWVVVVEVRYRADTNRGLAEESVGWRKRTHLLRAGRSYWLRFGAPARAAAV